MTQVNLVKQYIDPIIHHPVIEYTCLEIVKISVAKLFLQVLGKFLLQTYSKSLQEDIYTETIAIPILEEIVFRGILQKVIIHSWQYLLGESKQLSKEDKKAQEVFRLCLSALIFGCVHLFNPYKGLLPALLQFTWTTIGGFIYGKLVEKYHTLSIGILSHGFNNIFAHAAIMHPETAGIYLLAMIVNRIGFYILGRF